MGSKSQQGKANGEVQTQSLRHENELGFRAVNDKRLRACHS